MLRAAVRWVVYDPVSDKYMSLNGFVSFLDKATLFREPYKISSRYRWIKVLVNTTIEEA